MAFPPSSQFDILQEICQALVDKKAMNILTLDVSQISTMTDYFIIAEGNVERHVRALAEQVLDVCAKKEVRVARREGVREGEWIVLDLLDIVVHIFTPEMRHRYSLEEVWKASTIVSLSLNYGRAAWDT